jgi:hypothetical protein
MPARSEAQRRYLNMKFGHAWTKRHHFDNKGKLPKRAPKRGKNDDRAQMIEAFRRRGKQRKARRG